MNLPHEPPSARHSELSRAVAALQNGKLVAIYDRTREKEGDFAFAGKFCSDALVNFCISRGKGLLCLAVSESRAEELGIRRLDTNGQDPMGTPFGFPINAITSEDESGISAAARSTTIRAASAEAVSETDFYYPGHVHTLIAHPKGLAGRRGHTEAILDLLRLAKVSGPGALCEVLNDQGDTATIAELTELCALHAIPLIDIDSIAHSIDT